MDDVPGTPPPLPPVVPTMEIVGALSPWVHIWTRPRAVLRSILDADPRRGAIALPALAGVLQGTIGGLVAAAQAEERLGLEHALVLPFGLAGGIVFGPLLFLLMVNLLALVTRMTGAWLGGTGGFPAVRAAMVWSLVPGIWGVLLWAPRLALLGGQAFLTEPLELEESPGATGFLLLLEILELAIGVWALAIYSKCIGEAHGFSAWRGLGALLLTVLLFALAAGGVTLLGVMLMIGLR